MIARICLTRLLAANLALALAITPPLAHAWSGDGVQPLDYPTAIAAQLAGALDLTRVQGRAMQGVSVTVDLKLSQDAEVISGEILAVENAPDLETAAMAEKALLDALAHFESESFVGLPASDHALWGDMIVTFQLGLHVGGYQP